MRSTQRHVILAICVALCTIVSSASARPPNIVFFLMDDLDYLLNSTHPYYMPALHSKIVSQGLTFANYYVSTAVCCPTRTTLLTGTYVHNHNVSSATIPYGSYPKFASLTLDDDYLPGWLKTLGYDTYLLGKFMNRYTPSLRLAKGWTHFEPIVNPHEFHYYDPLFSINGATPVRYKGQYQTDVISDKASNIISKASAAGKPFYLQIGPVAPHNSLEPQPGYAPQGVSWKPPLPAKRHVSLFSDIKIPQSPNYNEYDVSDKPQWIRNLERLPDKRQYLVEFHYRQRLRAMRAVDEMIERLVNQLDTLGQLNNTYILFSSDNGWHEFNHRLLPEKKTAYQEDIRVPFFIRGPGIAPASVRQHLANAVDVAPTILSLAGGQPRPDLDGRVLPLFNNTSPPLRYMVPIEYWGENGGVFGGLQSVNYKSVLTCANQLDPNTRSCHKYITWCTGEHELYDLKADPYEMRNVYKWQAQSPLVDRLDAYMTVLATCKGPVCTNPFSRFHSNGTVTSWEQCLQSTHDAVYNNLKRFDYLKCLKYYNAYNELAFGKPGVPLNQTKSVSTSSADGVTAAGLGLDEVDLLDEEEGSD